MNKQIVVQQRPFYGARSRISVFCSCCNYLPYTSRCRSICDLHSFRGSPPFEGAVYVGDQPQIASRQVSKRASGRRAAYGRWPCRSFAYAWRVPSCWIAEYDPHGLQPTLRHSRRIAGGVSNRRFGRANSRHIGDLAIQELERALLRAGRLPNRFRSAARLGFQGKAEVSGGKKDAQLVGPGMDVPLAPVLAPTRSTQPPHDALSQWARPPNNRFHGQYHRGEHSGSGKPQLVEFGRRQFYVLSDARSSLGWA